MVAYFATNFIKTMFKKLPYKSYNPSIIVLCIHIFFKLNSIVNRAISVFLKQNLMQYQFHNVCMQQFILPFAGFTQPRDFFLESFVIYANMAVVGWELLNFIFICPTGINHMVLVLFCCSITSLYLSFADKNCLKFRVTSRSVTLTMYFIPHKILHKLDCITYHMLLYVISYQEY